MDGEEGRPYAQAEEVMLNWILDWGVLITGCLAAGIVLGLFVMLIWPNNTDEPEEDA